MYKVKMGLATTLIEDFSSRSNMYEKIVELPFVPQINMAIDLEEGATVTFNNIKYVVADEVFVAVCNGYQTAEEEEFYKVGAQLISMGWAKLDRSGTATVAPQGQTDVPQQ